MPRQVPERATDTRANRTTGAESSPRFGSGVIADPQRLHFFVHRRYPLACKVTTDSLAVDELTWREITYAEERELVEEFWRQATS